MNPTRNRFDEFTYYESGNIKTVIIYRGNGVKEDGFPMCYEDDGMYIGSSGTRDTCSPAVYGCTDSSDSCLPLDYTSPVPLE